MTTPASVLTREIGGRPRHVITAAWGAVSGVAPHVLHHIGPLAGAAILAGTGGRILFFVIGLAVATPLLIRLQRRFHTWMAPVIAIAIFGLAYTLSSVFIGPLISGDDPAAPEPPAIASTTDEHGH